MDIAIREGTSQLYEITCHRITQCYLPLGSTAAVTYPPVKAGTQLSDLGGMRG